MNRRNLKRTSFAWLVFVVAVAGCGSAASNLNSVGQRVGGETGGGAAPAAEPAPAASFAPADQQGTGSNANQNGAFKDEAKIVRTGSLSLHVNKLDEAVSSGRDQIRAVGGYVGASRQTNDGDRSVAVITYRIPSDRWDDALAGLRKLGTVLDEQTNAVEVTGQLIDLQARIDNLRASEHALQGIAEKATKVSDVLEVQSRLSDVRGQIEELDAQRAHLSDQVSYGTLSVTYGLQVAAVTEASKGWDPGNDVDRASASMINILQSLTSAGIWFVIVWLPILIGLGVVAVLAGLVIRRTGVLRRPDAEPPALPSNG
jgi:hypothetical protein